MKWLIFLLIVLSANLFAELQPSWSHDFIGSIKQIRSIDIDGDQKNEIVASGDSGIIAIRDDNSTAWYISTNSVDTLIPIQYDSDIYPEFAAVGWMDIHIFDNNGSQLEWQNLKMSASEKLPVTILNDKIVSYRTDSYDYNNNGLVFLTNAYSPFYYVSSISKNALASVDTSNDGKSDTLFGIANNNFLFKLDKDGNEDWNKTLAYDTASYLWAGKLQNDTPLVLIGTGDGHLHALDINGTEVWTQALSVGMQIKKIKKDKDGGFLILTNNDSIWYDGTQNIITKIDENNGSVLWEYASDTHITKALTQKNSLIAVGFDSGFKVFDENGALLQEANISIASYDNYLDVQSMQFGTLGEQSGLFVGTLDVNLFNDNLHKKIYSGGTLVQKIASGDMNGDGKEEIVVQDEHRLYLYSDTGDLLWAKDHFVLFDTFKFHDLTGNGKKELIVGYNGNVIILDYNGSSLWSKSGYYSNIYPDIDLYDYDGDGLEDMFISSLDYDTQKYRLEVWSGKDGSLLHEFGAVYSVSTIKVLNIQGVKKLFFSEYSSTYSMDFNATTSEKIYENVTLSYNNKLNEFKDINGDGTPELITAYNDSSTSLVIYSFDFTKKDEFGQIERNTTTVTVPNYVKMIKLYDYNNDGNYELLMLFPEGIYLYSLDGTQIWKKEILSQYGENRMLSDVKIVGDMLIVSGKEVYILNNNGVQLQQLPTHPYMSSTDYYLPTALAKTSNTDAQLIVGAMGLYGYTGVLSDTSNVQKLTYKEGWTLVATPTKQTAPLSAIDGLTIAWSYSNNKWSVHTTNPSDTDLANTLNYEQFSAIIPTQGVWVKTSTSGELSFDGVQNGMPTLHSGWNLVGGITTTPDLLYNQNQNIDIIWKYTKQDSWEGKSFIVDVPLDTLTNMEANEGFWVHVSIFN